jgi:hypothetical protein
VAEAQGVLEEPAGVVEQAVCESAFPVAVERLFLSPASWLQCSLVFHRELEEIPRSLPRERIRQLE